MWLSCWSDFFRWMFTTGNPFKTVRCCWENCAEHLVCLKVGDAVRESEVEMEWFPLPCWITGGHPVYGNWETTQFWDIQYIQSNLRIPQIDGCNSMLLVECSCSGNPHCGCQYDVWCMMSLSCMVILLTAMLIRMGSAQDHSPHVQLKIWSINWYFTPARCLSLS